MTFRFGRLAALVALAAACTAGAAAAEPTAHQMELSRRYIAAIHLDATMGATMRNMGPAMFASIPQSKLTPEQRSAVIEAVTEVKVEETHKLVERMQPVIADVFTEDELTQLVAFYESPVGQSLIAKSPILAQRMQPVLLEMMPEVQKMVLVRICSKIDCKAMGQRAQDHTTP